MRLRERYTTPNPHPPPLRNLTALDLERFTAQEATCSVPERSNGRPFDLHQLAPTRGAPLSWMPKLSFSNAFGILAPKGASTSGSGEYQRIRPDTVE